MESQNTRKRGLGILEKTDKILKVTVVQENQIKTRL